MEEDGHTEACEEGRAGTRARAVAEGIECDAESESEGARMIVWFTCSFVGEKE